MVEYLLDALSHTVQTVRWLFGIPDIYADNNGMLVRIFYCLLAWVFVRVGTGAFADAALTRTLCRTQRLPLVFAVLLIGFYATATDSSAEFLFHLAVLCSLMVLVTLTIFGSEFISDLTTFVANLGGILLALRVGFLYGFGDLCLTTLAFATTGMILVQSERKALPEDLPSQHEHPLGADPHEECGH